MYASFISRGSDYIHNAAPNILLDEIRGWIETAQPVSLLHPNGFLVLLLNRTESEEWRFHVWPQGRQLLSGMPGAIHTHDKQVDSRVLRGRLTNIVYSVAESVTGQPLYVVDYPEDKYDPRSKNLLTRTSLRLTAQAIKSEHVTIGKRYSLPPDTFHEAVVPDDICTCTLVRMHSRIRKTVKVIGLDGYPETITINRQTLTPSEAMIAAQLR
jgi:hypothetical protein